MKIKEILQKVNGKIETYSCNQLNKEYVKAFACDLMSDCLAFIDEDNCVLITGLINQQAIRTAEMLDIDCIIFTRGKKLNHVMIDLAKEENVTVITTPLTLYEVSGILYQSGLKALRI